MHNIKIEKKNYIITEDSTYSKFNMDIK